MERRDINPRYNEALLRVARYVISRHIASLTNVKSQLDGLVHSGVI